MNTEIIELCKDMVAIPSINPQDQDEIKEDFGEVLIADYVGNWLIRQNLDCQLQPVQPGRTNVLSVAEGADSSRTVLLCAHLDTVDVQGMTVKPFDPQIRNGKLYGRGSCDDKGPLATMMIAFRDRVQAGNLPCNLALLGSCGEEFDMAGSKYYVQQSGSQLCGAVMGEPTNMEIITAHKGVARLKVITKGKSAHSSMPQHGVNAIYSMADALNVIQEHAAGLKDRPAHHRLDRETFPLPSSKAVSKSISFRTAVRAVSTGEYCRAEHRRSVGTNWLRCCGKNSAMTLKLNSSTPVLSLWSQMKTLPSSRRF